MKVITSVQDWLCYKPNLNNQIIGLVPTMGNLHGGHYVLVQRSQQQASKTILTIYINPMQFAPTEDLAQYPRTLEADLEQCRIWGVDVVLVLNDNDMYPFGIDHAYQLIPPAEIDECYYGLLRPHFFKGVATVVCKLFMLIQPHFAVFGYKDAQQFTIINRMVSDMQLPLQIIGVHTARDEHGLALSSRNQYLSKAQKEEALLLSQVLLIAFEAFHQQKITAAEALKQAMQAFFKAQTSSRLVLDYVDIIDIQTFKPVEKVNTNHFIIIAGHVETENMTLRLLDTLHLGEKPGYKLQFKTGQYIESQFNEKTLV